MTTRPSPIVPLLVLPLLVLSGTSVAQETQHADTPEADED